MPARIGRCVLFVLIVGGFLCSGGAQTQTYTCPTGLGPVAVAPIPPTVLMQSLKTVANPVLPNGPTGALRGDLTEYIANQSAAIQLGKALFWEMQAGSDNKTACATCHFQAGADVRVSGQINAGPNDHYDSVVGPNEAVPAVPVSPATDDIVGSQGVRASTFLGFSKTGAELTTAPTGYRQVTGKNTPSVVNAVFNHRNFWNGRAQPEFNGVSPFGNRDSSARVWVVNANGNLVQTIISIQNASLASQAVGPPLNTVEMSAARRSFPDLGHKLLLAKPLGLQKVSSNDSVLGGLADPAKGLTVSYGTLIQRAFQPKWWNYKKSVTLNGKSYSMTEANFPLFWGLAIMLYEATLVANDSPMDQYLLTRSFSTTQFDANTGMPLLVSHNPSLLQPVVDRLGTISQSDILDGLGLFERPVAPPPSFPNPSGFGVGCIGCHVGAETTSASVRNLTGPGVEAGDAALKKAGFDLRMERMFINMSWTPPGPLSPVPTGTDAITFDASTYLVNVTDIGGSSVSPISLPIATYDTGWYNLGVRRTADDVGLGGVDAFNLPLSWTKLFQVTAPNAVKIPGNTLGCAGAGNATFPNQLLNSSGFPLLSGVLIAGENTDVDGTFKVATLRNVELNGPYFHNGGKATLAQVVDFYNRGGDFTTATNPSKAPAIVPLLFSSSEPRALVAFLVALTDERVLYQRAPFDHPELALPAGQDATGADIITVLPAVGESGALTPIQRFLNLDPFAL